MLPSGNELVRAASSWSWLSASVATQQMILDMKKTQMKVAKQWNTRRAGMKLMHPEKVCLLRPCGLRCGS